MQMKDVYCHVDSFRGGLSNMCVLYSTLTSLSLLFCLLLYICNFVELEFSAQNGGRASTGCYPPKSIRISPLGLLYSLVRSSERCVFITFEIWIFFLQKTHGFATGALYSL